MGCLESSEPANSSSPTQQPLQPTISSLKLDEKQEFPFYVQTPPLMNGNEAIFLYQDKNGMKYSTLDLNSHTFTKENYEFECDDSDRFDPFDSVYTLDTQNKKIYFIVNNKDIKSADLNTNQLVSMHKSITTTKKNFASIAYNNGKVYIVGAEEKSDECDEYDIVGYSTCAKILGNNKTMELIKKFGKFSRVIITTENGDNYMNIMGGQTVIPSKDGPLYIPNDSIWRYNINANTWQKQRGLVTSMHSFGIINYENKYLISFGGETFSSKAEFKPTRFIYILALQSKDEYGLETGWWYEVAKLPQKMQYNFHAIYNGSNVVHLFGYDGKYYTFNIETILTRLKDGHVRKKTFWTEAGKTAVPTKTKKIKNMGPKKDPNAESSSDESDVEQK